MLIDILNKRKCFKLICGAGNEDADEVEKLVAVYAAAGANFFDVCPDKNILEAAKRGLNRESNGIGDGKYICVSIGLEGDSHIKKAFIDRDKCTNCNECINNCPQNAVYSNLDINLKRCIGCGRCLDVCGSGAINLYSRTRPVEEILPALNGYKIDCIELHATSSDGQEIFRNWEYLNSNFDEVLSICINNSNMDKDKYLTLLNSLIKTRQPYTTIVQTDGVSMRGFLDSSELAQAAVNASEIVADCGLPVFIIPSGGTNADTTRIARDANICINGVAIGSYARKIVYEYISKDDFWENEQLFESAVNKAEELVKVSLKYL